MPRIIFASGVLLLVVVLVAGQPPLAPPAPPPTASSPAPQPAQVGPPTVPAPLPLPLGGGAQAPHRGSSPDAAAEAPLAKFQPLTAFPQTTQDALQGVLLGAAWMAKMNQVNGRFLYGYIPALRQPMSGDHDMRQARAAVAMAQAARFTGDVKHAAVASQAILTLLASTRTSPEDPNCRTPVAVSFVCNRVGFAALIAMAIYELPNAGDKLIDEAERLCAFLRRQLCVDGSIHYTDDPNDIPPKVDPRGMEEYPGLALHTLAVSNRVRPAEWKKEAVKQGLACYGTVFRTKPNPGLAATVIPAATELFIQTKLTEAATIAFEMADWLCSLQISTTDPLTPQWAGAFRTASNGNQGSEPPGAGETGLSVQALACAYQVTQLTSDPTREDRYRGSLNGAVLFLCGLQYLEANTRHFENSFRLGTLIGGVHMSASDGNLRIDATGCAMSGLFRYLSCGAERRGP